MFNVDWDNLMQQAMPPILRKARFVSYLKALLKPLKDQYYTYTQYRDKTFYDLTFNEQVMYLEKLLNDKYNNGGPAYADCTLADVEPDISHCTPAGIYITDSDNLLPPIWLWHKREGRPAMILYHKAEGQDPVYLWHKREYNAQVHFIIHVPIALFDVAIDLAKLAQLRALVDKYKAAGKKYSVVNY